MMATCDRCGIKVSFNTEDEARNNGWGWVWGSESIFCPYCKHIEMKERFAEMDRRKAEVKKRKERENQNGYKEESVRREERIR